jgi:hypothetical protein
MTGAAHAPPIKGVRSDSDSKHEKKIKKHFILINAINEAKNQPLSGQTAKT